MSKIGKFVIEHYQDECIGCAACAAINPKQWQMNGYKADLIGAKTDAKNVQRLEIDEADYKANKDAADACPVPCIFVKIKDENGKELKVEATVTK